MPNPRTTTIPFTPRPLASSPSRLAAALVAVAFAAGCAETPSAAPPATPTAPSASGGEGQRLTALYEKSIYQAAVVAPGDEMPLRPLVPDADGTFTVRTWAECRGTVKPDQCGSYVAGQPVQATWDIWVSGGNEVRNKCKGAADRSLRIWQILGMPPAEGGTWRMVTLTGVQRANIFRPCPDPRIDTTSCDGTKFVEPLPPNAPPDFYAWFSKQAMSSWQVSALGQKPVGYPWTRLGYTFDWDPSAQSRYGASEYVIPKGIKPLPVMVRAVETAEAFCG